MRHVVDASVALKAFLPEEHSALARRIVGRIATGELTALAPQIYIAEVGHTLRRALLRNRLTPADAEQVWAEIYALPVQLQSLPELADSAWQLAIADMGCFYDALYVALAILEGCQVVTADEAMVRAFADAGVAVFLPQFEA